MISLCLTPAESPGPFFKTALTRTPFPLKFFSAEIPIKPLSTSPVSIISLITRFAISTGIANPIPSEPPPLVEIETLTPISSPFILTRAPPELPGLIAASVCTYL